MDNLKKIKKEIKGKPLKDKIKIVKKYINLVNPKNITSGVYLIENFYVGKSNNIHNRIAHHIIEALSVDESDTTYNVEKLYLISKILNTRKLKIKILDKDIKKEKDYIEKLYVKLPLVNIEFVTPSMVSEKQNNIVNTLNNKRYKVATEKFTRKFYVTYVRFKGLFVFKIASKEDYSKTLLLKYLMRESVKRRGITIKNIKDYRYVAVNTPNIKRVFLQNENWEDYLKEGGVCKSKGFDNNIAARKWLKLKIYSDI